MRPNEYNWLQYFRFWTHFYCSCHFFSKKYFVTKKCANEEIALKTSISEPISSNGSVIFDFHVQQHRHIDFFLFRNKTQFSKGPVGFHDAFNERVSSN